MKNLKLNQWLWKWHVIAGLISLPFIIVLSITGSIYLFKKDYEQSTYDLLTKVNPSEKSFSYEAQLKIAIQHATKKPNAMVVPKDKYSATEFVSGRFSHKKSTYINPYTNDVTGKIASNKGVMFKIRKLHGELLLGGFGTKIVELIASWMVVLIVTGLFIWWPVRNWKLYGLFIPRINKGKKILFRDLHAICAFWIAGLLLLVLAGAFPWTDVFGNNFKQIQKMTGTGYPKYWNGDDFELVKGSKVITLDSIVVKAQHLALPGTTTITFPKGPNGVYTVSNVYHKDLSKQQAFHFNPFSGELLLKQNWSEVGILMRARMWVMAFHQGQFGNWNWWLMLFISFMLTFSTTAAIFSYFSKKKRGVWQLPNVPETFRVTVPIIILIICLGIVFPLFGLSALIIFGVEQWPWKRIKN